jgi:hypothetical protein
MVVRCRIQCEVLTSLATTTETMLVFERGNVSRTGHLEWYIYFIPKLRKFGREDYDGRV